MRKKLYLRQSKKQDEQKILDFYKNNQHEFVAARDPDIMEERIKSGAVTMLQDDNGDIQAISIAYPVISKDDNGDDTHKWTEIGSTHVLMSGMGLFDILVGSQLLNAFLMEPPEDRFVIEIDPTNEHSKHVFRKIGCTDFDDAPQEMIDIVNGILAPEDAGAPVEWFQSGAENMPELARKFLDHVENPIIKNKKTGEEYELDISEAPLGKHFIETLEKLAKNDYGCKDNPDMSQGLKEIKNKLSNFNPKP